MDDTAAGPAPPPRLLMVDGDVDIIDHWVRLGRAIAHARRTVGLTQSQLAERAGVSRAWLARVEAGHRKAELELLMRTLDVLGLSLALTPAPGDDLDEGLAEAMRIMGVR